MADQTTREESRTVRDRERGPTPEDLDAMTPEEFAAFTVRIGFDARITAALAECAHGGTPWCIVHQRLWVGSFDHCEAVR